MCYIFNVHWDKDTLLVMCIVVTQKVPTSTYLVKIQLTTKDNWFTEDELNKQFPHLHQQAGMLVAQTWRN
jgi:hypothetical protein